MLDRIVSFWTLPEQKRLSNAKHPGGIDQGRFWEGTEDHRNPSTPCQAHFHCDDVADLPCRSAEELSHRKKWAFKKATDMKAMRN